MLRRPVGVWAVPDPDLAAQTVCCPAVAIAAELGQLPAAFVTMNGILGTRLQRNLQLEGAGLPADSCVRVVQLDLVATPDRLLYEQPQSNGKLLLMKFATRYGRYVHSTLAAVGLAPDLIDVMALPGGWVMVVMELLDSTWQPLEECILTISHSEWPEIEAAVLKALARAHQLELPGGGKLVWADARPTNVMIRCVVHSPCLKVCSYNCMQQWHFCHHCLWQFQRPACMVFPSAAQPYCEPLYCRVVDGEVEVRFLDFDWSGCEGADTYPGFMNHQDLEWPLGVHAGQPLKQLHDLQMMQKTIDSQFKKRAPLINRLLMPSACARRVCSSSGPRFSFSWGSSWRTRLCLYTVTVCKPQHGAGRDRSCKS